MLLVSLIKTLDWLAGKEVNFLDRIMLDSKCFYNSFKQSSTATHLIMRLLSTEAAFHPIFFLHHSNCDRIYEKHVPRLL